ncbi:hypothetical protein QCD79_32440, partial [Pseudomonas quasicaspiana]|nr:hypothetical protein [Pseudomonas quasicaspiana]
RIIEKLDSDEARAHLGDEYDRFVEQLELVQGACHEFKLFNETVVLVAQVSAGFVRIQLLDDTNVSALVAMTGG